MLKHIDQKRHKNGVKSSLPIVKKPFKRPMSIAKKKNIAPDPWPIRGHHPLIQWSKVQRIAWYTLTCQKTCQFCRRTFWKVHLVFSVGKSWWNFVSKAEACNEKCKLGSNPWYWWLRIVKMHGNSMLYAKRSTGFVNVTTQRTRRCICTTFKSKNKKRKHHRFPCPPNRIQHFTLSCCKAGSGML